MKYIEDDFEFNQYKKPAAAKTVKTGGKKTDDFSGGKSADFGGGKSIDIVDGMIVDSGGETARFSKLPKPLGFIVSGLVWLASLALAFAAAYYLYRGGQYLIDLIVFNINRS